MENVEYLVHTLSMCHNPQLIDTEKVLKIQLQGVG